MIPSILYSIFVKSYFEISTEAIADEMHRQSKKDKMRTLNVHKATQLKIGK